jgi:hypothetical protein
VTATEKVRATRTEDRYHHFWASRRALKLLDLDSDLELISIEGARDARNLQTKSARILQGTIRHSQCTIGHLNAE